MKSVKYCDPYIAKISVTMIVTIIREAKISHNTKSKIWRQLCNVILPAKNVKIGKMKVMKFYRNSSPILLGKFRVIALKLNKVF